ncbi:protein NONRESPONDING TO OXYLIPINS 2, mitochondrial-like [Cicer arietinum]|uniref:Uncharacterized protein LOC101498759 n=1 Tax=Cicer arietinum TaxID=3827 RepID=A0A1S2YEX5_CICAR|nr:uncharacterized protein LOC101498759 [Cicer arietinum]
MATTSSKALCRLSCRLHSLALHNNKLTSKPSPLSLEFSLLKPKSQSSSLPRLSRLPVELGCLESMMPLYSAVASARLVSSLSIESLGWGLVPQGISMPL